MSGHLRKHASAISFFVLLLLLIPSIGSAGGEDPDPNLSDLEIMEFTISPTKDGYQGYLKIRNNGRSSATGVTVQVLDEEAGRNSNRTLVVTFPFPNPHPDSVMEKDFKWVPEVPGTHILRAIVEISKEEREVSKFNNVRSLMVTLPTLRSVTSKRDGTPDPMVFGDYISGIENMVELELTYEGIDDPSLMRVYVTVPGHFLEYGTMHSASTFRTMFDAGSLPPGEHIMLINSSYGGQHLSSENYRINIVDVPDWFDALDRAQSFYDRELSSYVFKGSLDIPEYVFAPEVHGIGTIAQVSLFSADNEMFLTGFVLLDRTTTYIAECDMELIVGEERLLVHQSGKSFAPSPEKSMDMDLIGEGTGSFDLSRSALGSQIALDGPYGGKIKLPIPSLELSGFVEGRTTLRINGSGPIENIHTRTNAEFKGSTVDIANLMLPGFDTPRVAVSLAANWSTLINGGLGIPWSENSIFDITASASVTDLGLEEGEVKGQWDIFHNGVGLDTALSPDGKVGTLELSEKDGHMTHLVFSDPEGESEVYVNNTYKSMPELEYLWDGRPMVVWTEAGYMEDREERASSLGLRYLIGNISGTFSGDPIDLFLNSSIDQHPSLASDHSTQRLALAWMRDMDGNISTSSDGEIYVAFLDGSGWSEPQRITEDGLSDRLPDLWFDPDGKLHLLWTTGTFSARYSSWSQDLGWTIPVTLDLNGSARIDHASFVEGDWNYPCSLFVTSSSGEPYKLQVGSIEPDVVVLTTITTSDFYISSPSMIEGYQDTWNAMWHIWDREGGDLEISSNPDLPITDKWSKSLRLTSDAEMEMFPKIFRNEMGTFTIGNIPVHPIRDNGSFTALPVFTEQNLSWGADTISLDLDPGSGSSPGTMIRAAALVEYRGMTSNGRVRVDMYRIIKDRETGGQLLELWDSEMVEFTALGQTQQVEFNVPVKEYQFGLVAVTGSALTGIPAHSSQKFSSLSALPDIEILTMDVVEISPEDSTASVEVAIKNWGSVSSGPRSLTIQSSKPTAPLLFENGSLEPLFLREREYYAELNSTGIEIPAGGTIEKKMNISLSPGMNNIWSVVKGPDWLPTPESRDHLVIPSFPLLELKVEPPALTKDKKEPIEILATVENMGHWPLNVSYLGFGKLPEQDMKEIHPSYFVIINGTFLEEFEIFKDITNISDLGPGENIKLNWTIPNLGQMGDLEIDVVLSDGSDLISDGLEDEFTTYDVIITSRPELQIASISQSKVGMSFANNIRVQFYNPSNYMIDVVHVTIYNGYEHDNVIISEAVMVGMGPNQYGEVLMHFPLQEGQYILTTTAEASVMTEDGEKMVWLNMAQLESDIKISKTGLPDPPDDDDEVSIDEVTTAGIITISSMMFVLLVASFFYRKETEEEEDEKV